MTRKRSVIILLLSGPVFARLRHLAEFFRIDTERYGLSYLRIIRSEFFELCD